MKVTILLSCLLLGCLGADRSTSTASTWLQKLVGGIISKRQGIVSSPCTLGILCSDPFHLLLSKRQSIIGSTGMFPWTTSGGGLILSKKDICVPIVQTSEAALLVMIQAAGHFCWFNSFAGVYMCNCN